ncbi:MAG TPA: hypothetical protein VGF55_24440 [Gemmataceae bacterium]|jgi:hypothetical protein
MGKVVLTAEMRARLNGLDQPLELYDEAGRLLAVCLPPEDYRRLTGIPPGAEFTDEEIAEAVRQTGRGRPLADIWKDLGRTT